MKKIVLLDVDKTLIDGKYKFTDDISAEIALCRKNNIEVGLCSDTPLEPLKMIASDLSLTGPIVAELGSIVFYPLEDVLVKPHLEKTAFFADVRKRFLALIEEMLPKLTLFVGNNTEFVLKDVRLKSFEEDVILVSGYREASLAFHCKSPNSEKTGLVSNEDLLLRATALVARAMREELASRGKEFFWNEFWIDQNSEYGIVIIHSSVTNKKNGVVDVLNHYGINELSMVGDSMYDIIGDSRVTQYWVGNALERQKKSGKQFIKEGEYVSPYSYTEGVKDILKKIISENRS